MKVTIMMEENLTISNNCFIYNISNIIIIIFNMMTNVVNNRMMP